MPDQHNGHAADLDDAGYRATLRAEIEGLQQRIARMTPEEIAAATGLPLAGAAGRAEEERRRAEAARRPGIAGAPTAYDLILADLQQRYRPTFRRGEAAYSAALGREVRRGEACAAPPIALVGRLLGAADCPRDAQGKPRRERVPYLYRTWAPSAWTDLLAGLTDESDAAEVAEAAGDQFGRRLAAALLHVVPLGHTVAGDDGRTRTEVQSRSLIGWAELLARPGPWRDIRSYRLWCRRNGDGRLQVAVRADLHAQVGPRELAGLSHRDYARQAELYGVGAAAKAGGERVVVLADAYVADLTAAPADPDGRMDVDDGTHAHVRDTCVHASISPQGGAALVHAVDADVDGGPPRASVRPRTRAGMDADVDADVDAEDADGRSASTGRPSSNGERR